MMTNLKSNWGLRVQGMALIIVVFVVGALVGGASERIRASQSGPLRPARMMAASLPKGFEQLGLTEEQSEAVRGIFEAARPATDSVMREMMPVLRAMRDSVHARIRGVLTAEQAATLDSLTQQRPSRPDMDGRRRFPGQRRVPADTHQ